MTFEKMVLVEKIVKIFKSINYFSNNIYLRCLTGFKYVPVEYIFWKYPEISLGVILFEKLQAVRS